MMVFIWLALAVLVGLPANKGRVGPTTARSTTWYAAKTPRAGPPKRDGALVRGGLMRKLQPTTTADPLLVAGDIELFAACLSAGLTVHAAATAVARTAEADTQHLWETASALLGVGVPTESAWDHMKGHAGLGDVAGLVILSGQSGATIAAGCTRICTSLRAEASAHATAKAERAGVFIALPLAVCFLPAFIVVGLAPVVISLGAQLF
ncbi:type II secretion system F family protein [Corynebacterium macginleyi]|uniref:Type II secretion system F family protein n=2 Tax=Corynebacterium macginleyi TaxID=38290 RepID=A0A3M0GW78_9CORY|nr:type II secretion system F family protein [Corynebacterium macginleyi]MBK4139862.1 type II secretion system F family protein [Corynebacterium macginleyi]MBK4142112.1 type II secretion system F family protein [Corynebacterium macginleyi]MBK4144384.1 type II secretion system F family protein [Corynebacterium macginleyi]MBK4147220.1 type II secretion system F family protein [Corynebacterium macginleyi]MBK4151605.1 type II secretion system F family protein [Corynebacterium macginleyi]